MRAIITKNMYLLGFDPGNILGQNVDFVTKGSGRLRETLEAFCNRTKRFELLGEWDMARNFPLSPTQITYGSKRKVWWQCEKGHHWQAAVHRRSSDGSGCPICSKKTPLPGKTDLATLYPNLASQWNVQKNGALTPEEVLPGSHRLVWWRCEKGHEWQAQVKSRTAGNGCPICANREILTGVNDLASRFPEIAAEWHPTRNGMLTPAQVAPGTRRKVWWRCKKGHEWYASVSSRTRNSGCPICAGKTVVSGENDLASRFPEIAAEWHPTRNGNLTACQVAPSSNRKVWWRCSLGHEYLASIGDRTQRMGGCPYCAGRKVLPGFNDLASCQPELARQWHPTLNGTLTPQMVTTGCHRKVWWECAEGHVWKAAVYSRTGAKKCGCPICAGIAKQKTRKPSLQPFV